MQSRLLLTTFLFPIAILAESPKWNASGLGHLPWQGISTHDLSDDGKRLAVGTIAPPGDPNVFLIDAETGELLAEWDAGLRWAQSVVAGPGDVVYALISMTDGTPQDAPKVYVCKPDADPEPLPGRFDSQGSLYHFGEGSNHFGVFLLGTKAGAAVVYGGQVLWLEGADPNPVARGRIPRSVTATNLSAAANAAGWVAVGCAAPAGEPNLFLFEPGGTRPVWSREALTQVDPMPKPEPGKYGSPTMPNGKKQLVPQRDVPVFGPLSVAIHGDEKPERIAAADHQGWQRWLRSTAYFRQQNYGTRFAPTRPTITVYVTDGDGPRQVESKLLPQRGWVDLAFVDRGQGLHCAAHSWTSRGLAGAALLPAESPDFGADFTATLAIDAQPEAQAETAETKIEIVDHTKIVLTRENGKSWSLDLNEAATEGEKPWLATGTLKEIGEGVWAVNTGRFNSDMGSQRLIEAPDGLILLEAHAGLSFDREWAAIERAGFDPMDVKYVIVTHEHGDHSPGAYLWRVTTGAKLVCSEEMAYHLQHHTPIGTGYGFHPPNFTDIKIADDTDLDLAGLKVRAIRLPGHTNGSMGWVWESGGKTYLASGDLIMPSGSLGYSGSVNFSARDVVASLRKIEAIGPDVLLAGHGGNGDPAPFLAGIEVGAKTGWARMPPENPDPFFNIGDPDKHLVVGWNQGARSGDAGDIDGDGRPDVALVCLPLGGGPPEVRVFLNKGGSFASEPDFHQQLPELNGATRICIAELNDDGIADLVVSGGRIEPDLIAVQTPGREMPTADLALLISEDGAFGFKAAFSRGSQAILGVRRIDLDGDGKREIAMRQGFGGFSVFDLEANRFDRSAMKPAPSGAFVDLFAADFNGDGLEDLASSYGQVFYRAADGDFGAEPSLELPTANTQWTFGAAGDFNGDAKPDLAMLSIDRGTGKAEAAVYLNTGAGFDPDKPTRFAVPLASDDARNRNIALQRDTLAVTDWNGDGIDDLLLAPGQGTRFVALSGGDDGLSAGRILTEDIDFMAHFEHRVIPADFNGDGKVDIAIFANTLGAGVGGTKDGPLGMFVRLH